MAAVVFLLLAAGCFVISYFQFHEKGFLLNHAYCLASKEEREEMNKKPYYRQSAITFFCLGVIFTLCVIEMMVGTNWLLYIIAVAAVVLLFYVIASSVTIAEAEE